MGRFFLHAVGRDRPGIVANVARALADIGCNLEDSRMTILQGHFAVMLIVDAPDTADGTVIEHQLEPIAEELDLLIAVRTFSEPTGAAAEAAGPALTVSVHGGDHPGIVARIGEEVAACGGNVIDLTSHVDAGATPSYNMVFSVRLPRGADAVELRRRLGRAAADLELRCVVTTEDR
ncbi:MAG TPA: ACT domain-containing protein [Acidimicrobiales bacterium]|nr:ACT domain-containing protein [Acidimicrobiales bacterium]